MNENVLEILPIIVFQLILFFIILLLGEKFFQGRR